MNKTTQKGFTLYELLITVLIVGVVLTLGIPNLSAFTRNSRMTSTANNLLTSFHVARGEAARAKSNITICASADSMEDPPSCDGTFEEGWIVFQDDNFDKAVDGDEAVLRRFPAVPEGIALTVDGDYFMFASTGLGRRDTGDSVPVSTVVMCDDRGNETAAGGSSAARVLIVTPLGRAAIFREVDQVDAQGGC